MSENTSIKELAEQIMPCDTSKPFAFVSYSKKDYSMVYPCIIALQQTGCNIWVDKNMEDQADLLWTELASEAIQNKNCVAIIFMISANSLISVPCFNEVLYSQKGHLALSRHRNNPVKLITVNTDSVWDPRRTHFSQWVYDESDKHNDDSVHDLSDADKTLLEDLGEAIEPKTKFNIPTSGDVATAFMNEVYGGEKEIDRTTVLPIESIRAIRKNISETMGKSEAAVNPSRGAAAVPASAPASASVPEQTSETEKVTVPPVAVHQESTVQPSAPVQAPVTVQQGEAASKSGLGVHNKKLRALLIAAACIVAIIVLVIIIVNLAGSSAGNVSDSAGNSQSSSDVASDVPSSVSSDVAYTMVTDAAYTLPGGRVSGTYTGKWLNDMPYEYGIMTADSGNIYKGEWKDGMPNGQGTATFASGGVYEGEWKDSARNGQGTMTLADGAVYEGEWKNDRPNGQGTMTYTDGDVYKCEFKDGKPNGQGTANYANGDVYKGEFKDGNPNGQGTMTYVNRDVYKGEWKDGLRNGQGTLTFAAGGVYEGKWVDDKFVGAA